MQNPYTGILAIFTTLARENQAIHVFEDGNISRDFVFIDDVVEATCRCIARQSTTTHSVALNVGSGVSTTIHQVATEIRAFFDSQSTITITGEFRLGDIRHNQADLTAIHGLLGYTPKWSFQSGLQQFLDWAELQSSPNLDLAKKLDELRHDHRASGGMINGSHAQEGSNQ